MTASRPPYKILSANGLNSRPPDTRKYFREKIAGTIADPRRSGDGVPSSAYRELGDARLNAGTCQTLHFFRLISEALSGMGKHLADAVIELADARHLPRRALSRAIQGSHGAALTVAPIST